MTEIGLLEMTAEKRVPASGGQLRSVTHTRGPLWVSLGLGEAEQAAAWSFPVGPSRAQRDGPVATAREDNQDETPWAEPSAGWT